MSGGPRHQRRNPNHFEQQALEALRAAAARESEARISFLRRQPRITLEPEQAPSCQCRTVFLWRATPDQSWCCFACNPPPQPEKVAVIRAEIAGRPVWNAEHRRWE
jgi:hypothetical protein